MPLTLIWRKSEDLASIVGSYAISCQVINGFFHNALIF